jgi:hypothetical protein
MLRQERVMKTQAGLTATWGMPPRPVCLLSKLVAAPNADGKATRRFYNIWTTTRSRL